MPGQRALYSWAISQAFCWVSQPFIHKALSALLDIQWAFFKCLLNDSASWRMNRLPAPQAPAAMTLHHGGLHPSTGSLDNLFLFNCFLSGVWWQRTNVTNPVAKQRKTAKLREIEPWSLTFQFLILILNRPLAWNSFTIFELACLPIILSLRHSLIFQHSLACTSLSGRTEKDARKGTDKQILVGQAATVNPVASGLSEIRGHPSGLSLDKRHAGFLFQKLYGERDAHQRPRG